MPKPIGSPSFDPPSFHLISAGEREGMIMMGKMIGALKEIIRVALIDG
jgi:hypothetical protein